MGVISSVIVLVPVVVIILLFRQVQYISCHLHFYSLLKSPFVYRCLPSSTCVPVRQPLSSFVSHCFPSPFSFLSSCFVNFVSLCPIWSPFVFPHLPSTHFAPHVSLCLRSPPSSFFISPVVSLHIPLHLLSLFLIFFLYIFFISFTSFHCPLYSLFYSICIAFIYQDLPPPSYFPSFFISSPRFLFPIPPLLFPFSMFLPFHLHCNSAGIFE